MQRKIMNNMEQLYFISKVNCLLVATVMCLIWNQQWCVCVCVLQPLLSELVLPKELDLIRIKVFPCKSKEASKGYESWPNIKGRNCIVSMMCDFWKNRNQSIRDRSIKRSWKPERKRIPLVDKLNVKPSLDNQSEIEIYSQKFLFCLVLVFSIAFITSSP